MWSQTLSSCDNVRIVITKYLCIVCVTCKLIACVYEYTVTMCVECTNIMLLTCHTTHVMCTVIKQL